MKARTSCGICLHLRGNRIGLHYDVGNLIIGRLMAHILVIEDDNDIRVLIKAALQRRQHRISIARNGPEGIRKAEADCPDLIICDILMPHLNGYDVYKSLLQTQVVPLTPFIFLTALGQRGDMRRGMVMGADDYIVKPFVPEELVQAVESVLARRALLEQMMAAPPVDYDVFISYSHRDHEHKESIRTGLVDGGFSVWTDDLIEEGRDWAEVVAESIKSSGCVVALLTEDAADSKWVGRELSYAEINETRIFPLLVRGEESKAIPFRLANHQFIDARDDLDAGLQKLIQTLATYLNVSPS